ncbi:putative G protein alpha chain [Favolaschia claudopus]|uniref:G protein alpha chain n=1 Tax=Favolaschia claudopus TaxID=2862362 RepID=A0AAV9ZXD2_9AGAR
MAPLARQQSRSSIFSWWSDSNPNLSGPTLNLHTLAKPLMKLMYHRQALEFIAQSRGAPLSGETLSIFSSYLPLNYVSTSTKIAILAELIDRVDVEGREALQVVMESPVWAELPELLKSRNSEIWSLAAQLSVLGEATNQSDQRTLTPLPAPTSLHPPRIWRNNLSQAIDKSLVLEAELRRKKELYNVKIIVLGPKNCGKTTMLKGIRSLYAPKAFYAESDAWRPVIRLNLVRSINYVIGLVLEEQSSTSLPELKRSATKIASDLREVEETLFSCIAPPEMILQAGWYRLGSVAEFSSGNLLVPYRREHMREGEERANQLLSACVSDMQELWTANETQQLLQEHEIELKTQPGFFLDDLQRICDENYLPTTSDILRTRVHNSVTDGPAKHEIPGEPPFTWASGTLTAYEMKGAFTTSERAQWAQFVDDVACLIFLIPISAFDEIYYENDILMHPLEQSFKQWRAICSNRLLASVSLTVCLTKIDILRQKVQSGKQFSRFVTSYLDMPNDAAAILSYASEKVKSIYRKSSPGSKYRRELTVARICATNPHNIASITTTLRADVVRSILQECQLLP